MHCILKIVSVKPLLRVDHHSETKKALPANLLGLSVQQQTEYRCRQETQMADAVPWPASYLAHSGLEPGFQRGLRHEYNYRGGAPESRLFMPVQRDLASGMVGAPHRPCKCKSRL